MLSNFDYLFLCPLLFKIKFFKQLFPKGPNSLDPDQAHHIVGPDLVPNCYQRLPIDDTIKQKG